MIVPTNDKLYKDLGARLPSWATRGLTRAMAPAGPMVFDQAVLDAFRLDGQAPPAEELAKDPVFGAMTGSAAAFYRWLAGVLEQAYLLTADGDFLDVHADDRGRYRMDGETDESLRLRLRRIPDAATETAIAEAILGVLRPAAARLSWRRGFWARAWYQRIAEPAVDVFTLRYRTGAFSRGTAMRHFFGRALWATSSRVPTRARPRRHPHWRMAFFGYAAWPDPFPLTSLDRTLPHSAWAVAVAVVPRLVVVVRTFWMRVYWGRARFSGAAPDSRRYRAIRQAVEETRAAGVQVEIWIRD